MIISVFETIEWEKKRERARNRDKKSLCKREARLPKTIYISLTIKVRKSSEQTGKKCRNSCG